MADKITGIFARFKRFANAVDSALKAPKADAQPKPTPTAWRYSARVLGCLRHGELELLIRYSLNRENESGAGVPVHLIPFDLRRPNSEFDILVARSRVIQVLRKDEPSPDGWNIQTLDDS